MYRNRLDDLHQKGQDDLCPSGLDNCCPNGQDDFYPIYSSDRNNSFSPHPDNSSILQLINDVSTPLIPSMCMSDSLDIITPPDFEVILLPPLEEEEILHYSPRYKSMVIVVCVPDPVLKGPVCSAIPDQFQLKCILVLFRATNC